MSPETVKKVLSETIGIGAEKIHDEDRLVEDLGMDSLHLTKILITAEDEYGIVIPSSELEKVKRVEDIFKLLKITAKGEK